MIYAFEGCVLDTERHELRRGGRSVELQPKVHGLLLHLIENRERVVSRDELFRVLWPDVVVSEDALFAALRKARAAVGDDGGAQRLIATVPKVGYRFVGAVTRPGATHPVAPDPAPGTASPPASGPPLVGRDAELAKARVALSSALGGSGRLVFVSGEAGIGKTRFASEVVASARGHGADLREATSWHGPGEPALWLWTQIVRTFVHEWSAADLSRAMGPGAPEIARLAPELAQTLGLEVPPVRDTDEARFLQMDALARFLTNAARERPQVLLLEDLQWAPPATLHVLSYLAREIRHARILIVATCRTEETRRDHPLFEAISAFEQPDALARVSLAGLAVEEISRLVAEIAGFTPPPPLRDALHAATGGNPFFVKQIVKLAADETHAEGAPEARLASHLGRLPASVRHVLDRRLALLSEPCRQMIEAASVIGSEFTLAILARICDVPRETLLRLLEEAVDARLLEPSPRLPGEFCFAHALVRDAAYAGLREPVRVRLHGQVAQALEALHAGRLESVVSALAHHYGEAAPLLGGTQAVDLSKWAGDLASAALSYEEAAAHYDRALRAYDLLPGAPDPRRRTELLVCLGYAHHNAGDSLPARVALRDAARLALGAEEPALLTLAAAGYSEVGQGAVDPDAVQLLEAALTRLGPGGGFGPVWIRALLVSHLMNFVERQRDAVRLAAEAESAARESGDARSLCYALCAQAALLRLLPTSRPDERVAILHEVLERVGASGDRSIEVLAWIQLRGALLELGDLAGADAASASTVALVERMRTRYLGFAVDGFRLMRLLLAGRFDEAEVVARSSIPGPEGPRGTYAMAATAMAAVRWGQGRLGEIGPVLDRLVIERPHLHAARPGRMLAQLDRGDWKLARADFEDMARHEFRDIPGTESFVFTLALLADVCIRLGDVLRAGLLIERLGPYAPYCVSVTNGFYVHGPVALHLGALEALRHNDDAAERHLEVALERSARLDSPVWRAATLAARARLHLRRTSPADRAAARAEAAEATEIAKRLGMAGLLRDLRQLEPSPGRAPAA